MDKLLDPQFWQSRGPFMAENWPIILPLLLLAGVLAWWFRGRVDDGEVRALRATNTLLDTKLKEARSESDTLSSAVQKIQADVATLKAHPSLFQTKVLDQLVSSTTTLATANSSIHHILNAEPGRYSVRGNPLNFQMLNLKDDKEKKD